MTIPRMIGLLTALTMLGVAVVALRVEQSIVGRRIQQIHFRQMELRQRLWSQDIELAKLRSPHGIRERSAQLGLPVGSSGR